MSNTETNKKTIVVKNDCIGKNQQHKRQASPRNYNHLFKTTANVSMNIASDHDISINDNDKQYTIILYYLSDVLVWIVKHLKNTYDASSDTCRLKIKTNDGELIEIGVPMSVSSAHLYDLFSGANFLQNFKLAFNTDTFSIANEPVVCKNLPSTKIKIKNNLETNLQQQKTINFDLHSDGVVFRFLTCFYFSFMLGINNINVCSCFPSSVAEFIAWKSNIYMNCLSADCIAHLEKNPSAYDSRFIGPCDNYLTQAVIVSAKLASVNGNIKLNINLNQIANDIVVQQQQQQQQDNNKKTTPGDK